MTASTGPTTDANKLALGGDANCELAGQTQAESTLEDESAMEESPVKAASAPLLLPGMAGRQRPSKPALAISLPISRREGEPLPYPSPAESSGTPVQWVTDTVTTPAHATKQHLQQRITPAHLKAQSISTSLANGFAKSESPKSPAPPGLSRHLSWSWDPKEALVWAWHGKLTEMYHDYTVENLLGQGRYGAVFVVQHKVSGHNFACKLLQKIDHDPEVMRSEIAAMKGLDHPNIVRIYETIEDKTRVFLLMELCNGGDLWQHIHMHGHLTEQTTRCFSKQFISALAYCHDHGVVHQDVKPENILIQVGESGCSTVKLADFGVASSLRQRRNTSVNSTVNDDMTASCSLVDAKRGHALVGSLPYMSPEVLLQELSSPSPACDMWSCGVVVYAMLSGDLPFADRPDLICSGMPPNYSGQLWHSVSEEAISLIKGLLKPKVDQRWTAKQALAFDWFRLVPNRQVHLGTVVESPSPPRHSCSPLLQRVAGVTPDRPQRELSDHLQDTTPSPAEDRFGISPQSITQEEMDCDVAGHFSCEGQDLAKALLVSLCRWKQMPKLRRIALAAIARRLDVSHPAQRLAVVMYEKFKSASDAELQCEELVRRLSEACSSCPGCAAVVHSAVAGLPFKESTEHDELDRRKTMTGLHVRWRLLSLTKRLLGIAAAEASELLSPPRRRAEQLPCLAELTNMVNTLDGMKNGTIDYTLLVAALLQPENLDDRVRIAEAFNVFDPRGQGKISPGDLQMTIKGRHVSSHDFRAMIAEYDLDMDGMLDLGEFESMVRGLPIHSASTDGKTCKVCPSVGGA